MKRLEYQLKQLTHHNRDGSFQTQSSRRSHLAHIARQLNELGFNQMSSQSLRRKHIDALIAKWKSDGLSPGSMKNYMSFIRWWAQKVGKSHVVPESNAELNLPRRQMIPTESKAQFLCDDTLNSIPNERLRVSIELQQQFGLRREECLKFSPSYADQDSFIRLKGSWTKGGRAREIPVLTKEQRNVLDRAWKIARRGSMIPKQQSFKQWKSFYKRTISKCGLENLHGLRHGYAQRRYEILSGWPSPFAGGPTSKELSAEDRKVDQRARLQVSQELGHNRIEITDVYLGH